MEDHTGSRDDAGAAEAPARRLDEEHLRRVLDAIPTPVSYVDAGMRFRYNNRAYDAWAGRPREELYGLHVRDVLGERAYADVLPYAEQALAGREVYFEKELEYADGTRRRVGVSYVPDFDAGGSVSGFVAHVKDLTARERAEAAVDEAERRALGEYETLLHRLTHLAESLGTARDHLTVFRDLRDFALVSVPCVGIFISFYDEARGVRVASYGWGDGEEVDVSSLPPMPLSAAGPNSQAIRTRQVVITNDYWARKQQGLGQLGVLVGPDNGLRPQSSLVVPMATMGRIVGTVEVQSYENHAYREEHVTAVRMAANLAAVAIENMRLLRFETGARAAAEEASRLKDEFLATLSHELRTPLTAILGWSSMLRDTRLDEKTFKTAVEIVERNARTQQQIVDDILDVSRIITGHLRLDAGPTDLREVVGAAVDTVVPAAAAKSIRLRAEFDPGLGPVMGDPRRLQQVVWNLLLNAVKFTPIGGEVRARLCRAGAHARLAVSDTGAGIRPDFLPHVFDRFRQGDQSTTRVYGGLGLGLSIVRHLVELHGGTVSAESEGEGRGSTFTVELPLVESRRGEGGGVDEARAGGVGGAAALDPRAATLRGLSVLVVDDEPDALHLIKTVLEMKGASVRAVGSAEAAWLALEAAWPDLLVCDIGMPGEDGYSLMRRVRAHGSGRGGSLPSVALTAYAGEADRALALEAGYQLHVAKPVDPAALVEVVTGLVGGQK
ncbi:MAG TPA: ATP-binding protein [Pyrinomonadaceae bacterium]|jgi:PAS domain S-box-containing protein